MYVTQEIADTIKSLLKQQHKNTKDMLEKLDMGINAISEFSKGKQMSCISLARIADYLNCSVDYLLGRTKNPSCNLSENDYNQVIKAFPAVSTQNNTSSGDMALQTLLHNYSGLNQAGRDRLVEYSRFVASSPEYQSESGAPEVAAGETVRVFIAARSTDNTPPQWVDLPVEEVERIFSLPESDFDL